MIAKRIPKRQGIKGSFSALARYITEKADQTEITNCLFEDDLADALYEIKATQNMNTRTKKDKTYHLMYSFQEGEQPSDDQIKQMTHLFCEQLGFEEHQRIAAVHKDTANWHVHVAVNQIHPATGKFHDPYRDFYTLSNTCRDIEVRYGLGKTRGIEFDGDRALNPKAADMEIHTGKKSLITWVKERVAPEINDLIEQGGDWKKVHFRASQFGLRIRKRGNGLVIQDRASKITVKGSDIQRDWSLKGMETKLGQYVEGKTLSLDTRETYGDLPIERTANQQLWTAYQTESKDARSRSQSMARQLKTVSAYTTKRMKAINAMSLSRQAKAKLKKDLYAQSKSAREGLVQKRRSHDHHTKTLTWTAYLQREAEAGNNDALRMLISRQEKNSKRTTVHTGGVSSMTGSLRRNAFLKDERYKVGKRGQIVYSLGKHTAIDRGYALKMNDRLSDKELKKALLIATQLWQGKTLKINGTKKFKERCKAIAEKNNIQLRTRSDNTLSR